MSLTDIDTLPGFRRRFRITPRPGIVCCEVEDDIHCMVVTVRHEGGVALDIEAEMRRAPWTPCPGAVAQLEESFRGLRLDRFASRGDKKANCTHLYDLVQLAAAYAPAELPVIYDIVVSDAVAGKRMAALRRDGMSVLNWVEEGFELVEPAELAGMSLWNMNDWIATLDPLQQEAVRLLRWGNILANGRSIPMEQQSDATRMPPNCYTFQPERARDAKRVGEIRDFSSGKIEPLADYQVAL